MTTTTSTGTATGATAHPDRQEIARYLLTRGVDPQTGLPDPARVLIDVGEGHQLEFPAGLTPTPVAIDPTPAPDAPLPKADVVVITWTVDELAGLAHVLTPGVSPEHWYPYTHNYETFRSQIRSTAPSAHSKRLASYFVTKVGSLSVLCMKSELHLNQDSIKQPVGPPTLPVKDLFKQIIAEASPSVFLTVGTAGSVFERFGLGDVVVSRSAKFRCQSEFKDAPFNGAQYQSDWDIPLGRLDDAAHLMRLVEGTIVEPPFAPPTKRFRYQGDPITTPGNDPQIRLDGRDMPAFHPILTTDYFEYGTTANRLDKEGAAVEMGDAALGLACSEIADPPHWAAVRNMSDPTINGDLPAKQYRLNEQTTWAVGYYTAYGRWTSTIGALTTWGILAGLSDEAAAPQ